MKSIFTIFIALGLLFGFSNFAFASILGSNYNYAYDFPFIPQVPEPTLSGAGYSDTIVILNADDFSHDLTGGISHGEFVATKEIQEFVKAYEANPNLQDTKLQVINVQGQLIGEWGNPEGNRSIVIVAMAIESSEGEGEINFTLNDVISTTVQGIELAKQISDNPHIIVNWSLGTPVEEENINDSFRKLTREVIDAYPDVVFVAAGAKRFGVDNQGNITSDPEKIVGYEVFENAPAVFARDKDNVISVGSHEAGGTEFDSVTLLANGSVQITNQEGVPVGVTGNSFAAPEVTMATALSWLENPYLNPGDLRDVITQPTLQTAGDNYRMLNTATSVDLASSWVASSPQTVPTSTLNFDFSSNPYNFGFFW